MSPAALINAGYRLERARTASAYAAALERVRAMLREADDKTEARYLIERGRQEART
jgi:hypothetical protein